MIAICLAGPDELSSLIRDMQERGRNPLSIAFQLVKLGYFTAEQFESAVRLVARHFRR